MAIKTGDTVRFLNSVGGGTVIRIENNIAYVADEDGFETPALLRECVVVGNHPAMADVPVPEPEEARRKKAQPKASAMPQVDTPHGDLPSLMLAFEPSDIKALSQSSMDAFLVNDSNYTVDLAVYSSDADGTARTLRYAGTVGPNIQEFLFDTENTELSQLARIRVQAILYKEDKDFEPLPPLDIEYKVETVKFAKLHCFRPNIYFSNGVLAFELMKNGHRATPFYAAAAIENASRPEPKGPATSKPSQTKANSEREIVDLHASELFTTTAGLTNADILGRQLEVFRSHMDAARRLHGKKIIFIHGKGNGVLRQAILQELARKYKNADAQDASFREYGFGATEVTIH